MAESVFVRTRRLLTARIEDTLDAMEQANSGRTMREAIREVDRTIDDVRADREAAIARRNHAGSQQHMIATKIEELTEMARFALSKSREDLAEGALSRQLDLERQIAELDQVQQHARDEEEQLDESLAALRARKRQMEDALMAFTIAQKEAAPGGSVRLKRTRDVERRVERAGAAFDRALTGAGGVGLTQSKVEDIDQVAEIDSLRKSATVAERLAALKQANPTG